MNNNIKIGEIIFKKNGVLASGIMGVTGSSMVKAADSGAGAVTCKSISFNSRKGHPTPVVQAYSHGLLNAVGLSSTGVENTNKELKYVRNNSDVVIIASVFGGTQEEFIDTISALDKAFVDIIELNISCPNVHDEFGLPFASSPETAGSLVKAVRKSTTIPMFVKLSPNFPLIGKIAKACEDAGADGITAINTVGPGMLIDIETFQPKLSNKSGGISGPAILPVAVRSVYDIFKSVKIPIIGMGGINSTEDALQMIIAGATLYGVGTGIVYNGLEIFDIINQGIDSFIKDKSISYNDLIGMAHKV